MVGAECKVKLRTSNDVYDRLKWDESLQQKFFPARIGVEDRFRGFVEVPFEIFVPGGDIPFHRIHYFRTLKPSAEVRETGGIIWDRKRRLDLLFDSGATEEVRAVRTKQDQGQILAEDEKRLLMGDASASEETRLAVAEALRNWEEDQELRSRGMDPEKTHASRR